MSDFFNETRKAWAAAATTFGAYYTEALSEGVTSGEYLTAAIFALIAWVVTWAVPNKPTP